MDVRGMSGSHTMDVHGPWGSPTVDVHGLWGSKTWTTRHYSVSHHKEQDASCHPQLQAILTLVPRLPSFPAPQKQQMGQEYRRHCGCHSKG